MRAKNWVEINDDACETYNKNSQIKFKTTMLQSTLLDCSDGYILAKGTITAANTVAREANPNNAIKKNNIETITVHNKKQYTKR